MEVSMTYNESDDILERQSEISILRNKIASLDRQMADLLTEKKFAQHRLSDLEWESRKSNNA